MNRFQLRLAILGPTCLLLLTYLAGGFRGAVQLLLFIGVLLLPAGFLFSRLRFVRRLPPGERLLASTALLVLSGTPWLFLRKISGTNVYSISRPPRCSSWQLLSTDDPRAAGAGEASLDAGGSPWPFFHSSDGVPVRPYSGTIGARPHDFGALVSVVTTVRVHPLLPSFCLPAPAYHHWLLHLPATLADFLGWRCRTPTPCCW